MARLAVGIGCACIDTAWLVLESFEGIQWALVPECHDLALEHERLLAIPHCSRHQCHSHWQSVVLVHSSKPIQLVNVYLIGTATWNYLDEILSL